MAVVESGMGIVKDKVIKITLLLNTFIKTCSILAEDGTFGAISISGTIGLNKVADIVLQAVIVAWTPQGYVDWIDNRRKPLTVPVNSSLASVTYPIVVGETADIKRVVASVLMSKTFDNGVIFHLRGNDSIAENVGLRHLSIMTTSI
ncbi:MAG: Aldehyde-alcohol dehydrogenase [Sodalis sp.]|nr:MAG: Aldehyde-alcohol dehydrogenase [Sodalis sp.]